MSGILNHCVKKADSKSLVYFDPPYRPIAQDGQFLQAYIKNGFADQEQIRLKKVCDKLSIRDRRQRSFLE